MHAIRSPVTQDRRFSATMAAQPHHTNGDNCSPIPGEYVLEQAEPAGHRGQAVRLALRAAVVPLAHATGGTSGLAH
jgi:hypothetical protein